MEAEKATDLFQHPYYRLNKMFMKFIGQWPYQSDRVRYAIFTVNISIGGTLFVPQVMAIVKNLDDLDLIMEGATSLLFSALCFTKAFSFTLNSQKMLMLLKRIRTDWKVFARDNDVYILHKYAQTGRKMTIMFAVLSYISCILFVIPPMIPKIIDVWMKNGTDIGRFPTPIDYCYIDMQKYYFYIILHCLICGALGFIYITTYDGMFVVCVQHNCGLFAALGLKLQRMGRNERTAEMKGSTRALNRRNADFSDLSSYIDRHRDAIEYADLIEATNSWCFFVLMGINVLMISMTGFQAAKESVDRQQTIRYVFSNLACMVHLYIDNYMAQMLMDHSISIRSCILNGEWYKLPMKTQKILLFMMMRSEVSSKLTAGAIITLSMETFGVFLKTSLSYFMLLRSV